MLASLEALVSSVVDYAGLFPPAKLALQPAMENYAQYQTTPYAWMLGRFILPMSRLQELIENLPQSATPWPLSIIMTGDVKKAIDQLPSLHHDKIAIKSLEFPPLPPADIPKIVSSLPTEIESFFEIPFSSDFNSYLSVVRESGAAAKIRTGGVTVDAFPSIPQLCQSIFAFAEADVSFKATAGLHYPLPGQHPLTDEPNSSVTVMHGFLNLAILAALVYHQKLNPESGLKVLQESSRVNFQFTNDNIFWKDYQLNIQEIKTARENFFRSFGSCSFQVPIDELKDCKLF